MNRWTCIDCGIDTHKIQEYYMLKNHVWAFCVPEGRIMLCIGCVEKRLGRELISYDFADCELNDDGEDKSDRLLERMRVSKE